MINALKCVLETASQSLQHPTTWTKVIAVVAALPIAGYAAFIAALLIPAVQRGLIYLHWVRFPFFAKYNCPEAYGFAPNRVRNFLIETPDDVHLGTWHVLPQAISNAYGLGEAIPGEAFDDALRDANHLVMLYFHGNAGTRLVPHRRDLARHMTDMYLNMNFIAIDYRCFADSTRVAPSEAGLRIDARAAWDWLTIKKRVLPANIVIAGQSLGTGVATTLAADLCKEGIKPRLLFLTAAFTSIDELLLTYKAAESIPMLQPLRYLPMIRKPLFRTLQTHFTTIGRIESVVCDVLLVHSENDGTITHTHSRAIFDKLLQSDQQRSRSQHVETINVGTAAVMRQLQRAYTGGRTQTVIHLQTKYGGHDTVGRAETTLRVLHRMLHSNDNGPD